MAQGVLEIGRLPDAALEAASRFHSEWLPKVTSALDGEIDHLAIIMNTAPYDHADWRRAAARDLARKFAPKRVNIVAGDVPPEIDEAVGYLDGAPGVTGQYLPLRGAQLEALNDR